MIWSLFARAVYMRFSHYYAKAYCIELIPKATEALKRAALLSPTKDSFLIRTLSQRFITLTQRAMSVYSTLSPCQRKSASSYITLGEDSFLIRSLLRSWSD